MVEAFVFFRDTPTALMAVFSKDNTSRHLY